MKLKLDNGKELELILVEGAIDGSVDLAVADPYGNPYAGGYILRILPSGRLFRHIALDRKTGLRVDWENSYRIQETNGIE